MSDTYYTIAEVAAIFKVHPVTVRRWIDRKEVEVIELPGKNLRITGAELERITQSKTAEPA